ncbi:hypothetical protein GCM10010441_01290 [Kitasatospora paracochleata]
MLTNIMYVTLYVTDQDRALRFYTEQLGLEKRIDFPNPGGRFLTVGVPGTPVELLLWGTPPPLAGRPSRARRPARSSSNRTTCGRTSRCSASAG